VVARLCILSTSATGEQFGNTIAHVPQSTFPVVPLVVNPVEQAVHELAFSTGRASGAKVSAGQARMAVRFQ
jgi:hypothetical protein